METFGLPKLLEQRDGVLAFEKPAGFAVHPTNDPSIPDILTWLVAEGLASESLAPIHRLDRETSGVVLCAEDPDIRGAWGRWFAEGQVRKQYLALVYGKTRKRGRLDKPLFDRRRRKALPAETNYEQRLFVAGFSYLEVTPTTGRKHQIRQHLQGVGHAIVGDQRYRPRKSRAVPHFPGRLWLHAHQLHLPNGWVLTSPLPPELSEHLEALAAMESATSCDPGE